MCGVRDYRARDSRPILAGRRGLVIGERDRGGHSQTASGEFREARPSGHDPAAGPGKDAAPAGDEAEAAGCVGVGAASRSRGRAAEVITESPKGRPR